MLLGASARPRDARVRVLQKVLARDFFAYIVARIVYTILNEPANTHTHTLIHTYTSADGQMGNLMLYYCIELISSVV